MAPVAIQKARITQTTIRGGKGASRPKPETPKARLARVAARAPEVMVKITGRTKSAGHMQAHLEYISRNGALPLEERNGALVMGRQGVQELSGDWAYEVEIDQRHRANSPYSVSIVLSMPAQTDAEKTRDAVRSFAQETFGDKYEYVFALHTDVAHPHVHLSVRALGEDRSRLNPKKGDLQVWRETFARKLRSRGILAEATPRRARGVVQRGEKTGIRKAKERHVAGRGPQPRVVANQVLEAKRMAKGEDRAQRPWEAAAFRRYNATKAAYVAESKKLAVSADPKDRALARSLDSFVQTMPPPASRRMAMAREIVEEAKSSRVQSVGDRAATPVRPQPGRKSDGDRDR